MILTGSESISRLKILHVTREWAEDQRYGLGKSLSPLINSLRDVGHQVEYLCQEDLGHRSLGCLRLTNEFFRPLLRLCEGDTEWEALIWGVSERLNMGRLAARVATKGQYSHVHVHDPIIALGYRLLHRLGNRKARWGLTQHGFGSYTQAIHEDGAKMGTRVMNLLRKFERSTCLAADWVICPTYSAQRQLQRDLAIHPRPEAWRVIHHGKPEVQRVSRQAARERLGWEDNQVYALAVGRLVAVKNFGTAITAAANAGVENLNLIILGDGDSEPFKRIARECNFTERLSFAAVEDPSIYYQAADLYLCSSLSESFGLANLEALMAGLPIISTAVGGIPEVLGESAHWIPPNDVTSMARGIRLVLTDESYRQSLIAASRARSEHWPTLRDTMVRYELAYQQAMA